MGGHIGPDGYYRSRRNRQSNANRRRNGPSLNRTESYSHIQVVAHPDANSNIRQEPQSPFVQNKSLQDEDYNIASSSGFAPFSFAQVAANMSGPGRSSNANSRDITYDGDGEAAPTTDQASFQVVGPRRCTLKVSRKKPKKWSPFDLGSSEGEFDIDDTRAAIPKTDNPVPELPTSVQEAFYTFYTPIAETQQQTNQLQEFSPTPSVISRERRESFFGNSNTKCNSATDIAFNAAFPQLRNTPTKSPLERSIIHKEDPEDTKLRLEHIMARIDDVFDVEEWDPDLPAGGSNNSPEQLTIEPQKVTYTTVGSVAKTDAVPTFTPPIRIQREGSGRRLTVPAPRGTDNYYNRNQQPGNNSSPNYGPPTNMKNPRFSQQQYAPPPPLNIAGLENLHLSDLEKEVLFNTMNATAVAPPQNDHPQATSAPDVSLNSAPSGNFSVQKMLQEEASGPSTHLTGSSTFAGLNKMQTLQRLAQFENPAQVFAKGRLAEFKAEKMKQQMSEMAALSAKGASQAQSFEHGNKTGMHQFGDTGPDPYKNAVVSYGSQYPGQENCNPLQPGYNSFGCEYPMNGYGSKPQLLAPQGYPQPLTAGPPRQGQNSVAFNRLAWTSGHSQLADAPPQFQSPPVEKQFSPWNTQSPPAENQYSPWNNRPQPAEKQYSPWNNRPQPAEKQYSPWNNANGSFNQQSHPFSSTGQNHIRDTLSLEEMSKYYPNGFGPNFQYGGDREELDEDTKLSLLGLADDSLEAKQRRKAEKLDEWFYSGLSRLNMTTTDHMQELKNRDKGIIPSAPRANMANREVLSVKDIRDKTNSECAAPLIDNLFGILVAYSDNVAQPTNRRIMSKFVQSPAWALDTSEEGKKSIFGDDWVAPPKRLGRDPRYTRSKLSEMWD
ncbi:hypothetical protein GMDG_02393 [Pseudogymnoascus destructans 20631-21]|uniref:Uncharacterized protein n=1 Tax=Pseudogymnoascus destructans (strain ATCC MYA-4855 / 20631-21) TaxID=658429 RepID=L8G2V6_PSED2|nr:hypothetical protein GMDG_02393 [Pseudogymnoascus destructans 20631-21]